MSEGTELLSYALFLFLAYVYLPYTFFKFGAERSIDLGKRRDFTQLEEIISAFVPTFVIHLLQAWPIYQLVTRGSYSIDFSVMASMFGHNRGAVSDYIYGGDWWGCIIYFIVLWPLAFLNGFWFGRAVHSAAKDPRAVHGIDAVWGKRKTRKHLPWRLRPAWWLWYPFFHESIVPLFTWASSGPIVRVYTSDNNVYDGKFVRYEKTTDGRLDAIRLTVALWRNKEQIVIRKTGNGKQPDTKTVMHDPAEIGIAYIKWSHVARIIVIHESDDSNAERDEQQDHGKRDEMLKKWQARDQRLANKA